MQYSINFYKASEYNLIQINFFQTYCTKISMSFCFSRAKFLGKTAA